MNPLAKGASLGAGYRQIRYADEQQDLD